MKNVVVEVMSTELVVALLARFVCMYSVRGTVLRTEYIQAGFMRFRMQILNRVGELLLRGCVHTEYGYEHEYGTPYEYMYLIGGCILGMDMGMIE